MNSTAFVEGSDLDQIADDTNNLYTASFDIVSLFTNVPVMETIAIIINKIFAPSSLSFLGLSKVLFT